MKKALIAFSILANIVLISCSIYFWNSFSDYRLNVERAEQGSKLFKVLSRHVKQNAERRTSQFDALSHHTVDVVFLGDSLTEGGEWNEMFPSIKIANRGVGGDTTGDILNRIDQIFPMRPEKLFLMVGINDLGNQSEPDLIIKNYISIFDLLDSNLPNTKVYVQSILPVNDQWKFTDNTYIPGLNEALKTESEARNYTYIDLHTPFSGPDGQLKSEVSNDGIHLLGSGYDLWKKQITPSVADDDN